MYFTCLFYQRILPPLIKCVLIISFKHNSLAAHVCSPHKLHDDNNNNNNNNNDNNKIDSKTDRKTLKLCGLKNLVRNMRP